jgi:hypothetical protein
MDSLQATFASSPSLSAVASDKKIFERNPDTGVIRWRYVNESSSKYGWPNYGNILEQDADQQRKQIGQ